MKTVTVNVQEGVARVSLNRPDVRNAFNATLIRELTDVLNGLDSSVRGVVLTGKGSSFCAGADLNWMKESINYTENQNAEDAATMVKLFRALDENPRVVIARVNGPAMGGGLGLIACCDVVIAADTAKFGFSEVRLGIVPAVISPFVIRKIGASWARRFFTTGELFGAHHAATMGLVHKVVSPERLDGAVDHVLEMVLKNGPVAVAESKRLVREVEARDHELAVKFAVNLIASLRVKPEAQEGFQAFLEKRKPEWPKP